MLINRRNAMMAGKRLPYDAEVEYLESTGTQWIDLTLSHGSNTGVHIDYTLLGDSANTGIFGSGSVSSSVLYDLKLIIVGGSKQRFDRCDRSSQYDNFLPHVGTRQTFTFNPKGSLNSQPYRYYSSLNGRIGQLDTWYSDAYNLMVTSLCVFKVFNRQDLSPAQMQLHNLEFREYNTAYEYTVTASLIPVRRGNVGYTYDRVSGALFGNAGRDDFVIGPDKARGASAMNGRGGV